MPIMPICPSSRITGPTVARPGRLALMTLAASFVAVSLAGAPAHAALNEIEPGQAQSETEIASLIRDIV